MSVVYLITYEANTGTDGTGKRQYENILTQDHPVVWLAKMHVDYPDMRTVILNFSRMDFELDGGHAGAYMLWCLEENGGEIGDWLDWASQ